MKKLLMVMAFVLPLFLMNNVKAQNGSQGQPNVIVWVSVSGPANCPETGSIVGYIPTLGYAYENFNGYEPTYELFWIGTIYGTAQPCTVEVTTPQNSQGQFCHGKNTEMIESGVNSQVHVTLGWIAEGGSGGNEE